MLNIKNRETETAVRQLAERLGITLTEAVTVAVHHEIERLDSAQAHYLAQVREAAQAVQAELSPDDWLEPEALYDDDGLPR